MRHRIYLFLTLSVLCISSVVYGQLHSAIILDPENWSQQVDEALFHNVKMHITPQGAFANIELDMEVKPKSYAISNGQQLEMEYFFSLPKGSIIHEAYLWMEGVKVKAQLYEKSQANMIYESYVNRRTDPLIIYKNNNFYEARIYPFLKDESRRFKICFLVPLEIKNNTPILDLPFNLFGTHFTSSDAVQITMENSEHWGTPKPFGNTTPAIVNGISKFAVGGDDLLNHTNKIEFTNQNFTDKLFIQAESNDRGYFQMLIEDTMARKANPKSASILIYHLGESSEKYTSSEVMELLKSKFKANLADGSLFQVFYNSVSPLDPSREGWLTADSATVEQAMSELAEQQNVGYPNQSLITVLTRARHYALASELEEVDIIIVTNSTQRYYNSVTYYNSIISNLTKPSDKVNLTFSSVNLQYDSPTYNWFGNNGYIGEGYVLSNLAAQSGGTYLSCLELSGWRVTKTSHTLGQLSNFLDLTLLPSNANEGFKYDGNSLLVDVTSLANSYGTNKTYSITGRYLTGIDSLSLTHFYEFDDNLYQRKVLLKPETFNAPLVKKIWAGSYYNNSVSVNNSSTEVSEIVKNSLAYEVLTDYTAFLALESDSINHSNSENIDLISIDDLQEDAQNINIKAFPNPFRNSLTLDVNLANNTKNKHYKLTIVDMAGRVVYSRSGNSGLNKLLRISVDETAFWKSGFYIAKLEIGNKTQHIKILKE
jgi:hypothetical protein